jgi:PleD family two-component response regulator
VRTGEHLGRTGAAELAWLMPDTDAIGGVGAVERMRSALRRAPSAQIEHVTLTAGVCDLAKADDALSLYALADRALADARSTPGSTTRFTWATTQPAPEASPHL